MLTTSANADRNDQRAAQATPDRADWPQLLTGIGEGDEAAFSLFYDRFFDRLFRYVVVMTRGDEQCARDVLQKTMLKVVRYAKPFPDEPTTWSWLTQLAKTSYIDLLRSQNRAPAFVTLEAAGELSQTGPAAEETDAALEAALDQAVKRLPPDEQQLIQSVYYDELSHKELAQRLQSSPKAVESKLARVRVKLRNLLTRILHDENRP